MYDNMFNNAFKSLIRVLKENGFPYKCRLYGNSRFYSGFVLPNVQKFFVQKISLATFRVSIDDFFTRYAGLGYSLYILYLPY